MHKSEIGLRIFIPLILAGFFFTWLFVPIKGIPRPNIGKYTIVSPCAKPRTYSVASVDPKYGMTREEVVTLVSEAASVWNAASGWQIFSYSTNGDIPVTLSYDERQALADRIQNMEGNLNTRKSTLDQKSQNFERDAAQFKKKCS